MRTGKHDRQHGAAFAKGGNTRMFGKQAAGPDRPGQYRQGSNPGTGCKICEGRQTPHAPLYPSTASQGRRYRCPQVGAVTPRG